MSALTTPFVMPRVQETIPDFAFLKDRLTGSSVIEERYTATQVPSSGDSYTVGGSGTRLMIVRIASQNDYIDTSTMVLNFRAISNQTSTGLALDDHILSLVDTINVKVGGQTVEVLNNVGHLMNALVQGSMPYNYYKQNGGFEGLYIYDKWADAPGNRVPGGVAVADANNADVTSPDTISSRWSVGNSWLENGRYYAVPLTLLGLCRIPTLFAARNFQDLTIEILFRSQLAGAAWVSNPSAAIPANAATTVVNISDVTLTYDCCRMSADYYALMDAELKMPNGSGVSYPIDTYQVQPASIAQGASAGTGVGSVGALTRIVVAKGTRFLKGVYGVSKPTASESSFLWRNNSSAGNFAFSSYQVIINSKRYPQLQIQSSAAAFQELQKAYNQLGSVTGGAVISWFNYVGQPVARLNGTGNTQRQDATASGTKDGTLLGGNAGDEAMFQNGVNLEQFLTNQPDAGGINTSTSGYQIAVEIQNSGQVSLGNTTSPPTVDVTFTAAPLTHYCILHFTRVLTLKAGAVEVLD